MRIFIGGDITPTDITKPGFDRGDIVSLFGDIPELLKTGDRVIANLECALTQSDTPIRKCGPNLRGRPAYAQVLRQAGITDVGLANNHVFDFGRPGYDDTLRALAAAGLPYTGVGENEQDARRTHYMDIEGKKIALLAFAEHEYSYALDDRAGVRGFDPYDALEDIALARSQADYVLVTYHGGKEQSRFPSPRLRKACRAMARAGANAVLCQHSHCIGAYEEYRGAHLLYGQGNFNFVGYIDHPHWKNGLLVQLDLDAACRSTITFHPLVAAAGGVTLAGEAERARLLGELRERSELLQDEKAWLAEWHQFCADLAPQYRQAVAGAFPDHQSPVPEQIFPHYLDCEAHTDVWRELYPTWHREKTDETGSY
ncbi:MAG: CapA family protein [Clostridiaceae bacterium]|nr:CapA family protein [Clostridiaceae bacterium]